MMTIVVANFLPNAFSNDQAEQLKEKIVEALKTDDKIIIDFRGITKFTALFFNFIEACSLSDCCFWDILMKSAIFFQQ